MSALKSRSNSLAGLTLDAVLGGEIDIQPSSPPSPPPSPPKSLVPHRPTTQTLFDIIREEYANEGHKDRTTWQIFREKLRLRRTGVAWTSSLLIPASDILIPNPKLLEAAFRSPSTGLTNDKLNIQDPVYPIPMSDPPGSSGRAMFSRGSSMRVGSSKNPDDLPDVSILGDGPPSRSFKPQLSRHDSVRDHADVEEDNNRRRHPIVTFVEERQMSAREAVAAQEAAEAEAAAAGGSDDDEEDNEDDSGETEHNKSSSASSPKQTMSLMDLLEETDRQMGLTGSRYDMDEDEDYEEEEEEEEEEENYEEGGDGQGGGEGELSCCVCYVKIKGASFTPCGHTFCKLCSKELMAQKGHCPICSSFVLEFLEIF